MKKKLIVIEGLDGSGKKTQTKLLFDYLNNINKKSQIISFPDYNQPSSSLIKMYLNSEFGENPSDVNAYAASSFFAIDRYASYKKFWEKNYKNNEIIISDRYTTSNAIYQMTKIKKSNWDDYLTWLYDYEYIKLELPVPDVVIYLYVPVLESQKLLEKRYLNNILKKDLHEKNINFLEQCEKTANYLSQKYNWNIINCFYNQKIKTITQINDEVLNIIKKEVL